MLKEISEFTNSIILCTALILILCGFIVFILIMYYLKRKKHLKEQESMKKEFKAALIQTEFEVQEQTRKNLASELHDNIGQLLSLTNVTLASININEKAKTKQKIDDTLNLVTKSIKELRQLSKIIYGEQLLQQGLIPTIEQEIIWLQRNGQFLIEFINEIENTDITNTDKDLFIFRLLQESINNIIKHAEADKIIIHLKYVNDTMQLTIQDNGIGFNSTEKINEQNGLGLLNMQKRINLLKGRMHIDSIKNLGTKIIFIIPYP